MKSCKCENECADNAKTCPKCGYGFSSMFGRAVAVLFVLGVLGFIFSDPHSAPATAPQSVDPAIEVNFQRAVLGAKTLKSSMRNPGSFELARVLVMDDGAACYTYRAQNGFGGMNAARAVATPEGQLRSSEQDGFRGIWNRECATKTGLDKTWVVNYAATHS